MEALSLDIFIVPTLAMTLVVLMYFHFAKQVRHIGNYRNYIIGVGLVAFSLNFIWELAQGPLYESFKYDWEHVSFCALASVADMLMLLILLFGFGLIYRNVFWVIDLSSKPILVLVTAGTIGAILGEVWHTSRGDWAYAESMPMLPWVEVGISPILQFALLPSLIFLIGKKLINENISEI